MLGTDGFGNLLPFMPIKQDWFFKYVYKPASRGSDNYYTSSIEDSDFGDDDEIVLISNIVDSENLGQIDYYRYIKIKNNCSFNLSILFGYGMGLVYAATSATTNSVFAANYIRGLEAASVDSGNLSIVFQAAVDSSIYSRAVGMLVVLSKS